MGFLSIFSKHTANLKTRKSVSANALQHTATDSASPSKPVSAHPTSVRRHFAANLAAALGSVHALALSNGGYKVVSGRDQENRPLALAESGDEFKQLSQSERNRIISFARKLVRNSEQMEAILHQ